jgi:thymidylate kinase
MGRLSVGELVALCGIDGTGKSTQALLLRDRLRASDLSTEVLWCRWDPFLARPAIRLLDRLSGGSQKVASKSDRESGDSRRALKRRILSIPLIRRLWTGLMVLDYGLQVAPKLLKARRSADIVIVDRYRHDVLVDLSAGGELVEAPRILRCLLPDPDLVVVLDIAEETALARKPDSLDLTYLTERRRLYLELVSGPTAVLVDASESTDAVSESVFEAVSSHSIRHGGINGVATHHSRD